MNNEFDCAMESQREILEQMELPEGVEIPEGVELLERPGQQEAAEYSQESGEANEVQETVVETRELTDGLEVDTVTREGEEPTEDPAFEYSEPYVDEYGVYHPAQITGVYADALEDPECQEMLEDLNTWEQQEERMSCAVQCQRMIIEDLTGNDVTEAELREMGKQNGWFDSDIGTYLCDVGKLAECHGLAYEQHEAMTIDEMIQARESGANLIVAVDAYLLSRPDLDRVSSPNHAVEVIDVDYSNPENPMVILNDPGRSEGRGSAYPMDIFLNAACETNQETGKQTLHWATTIFTKEAAQ